MNGVKVLNTCVPVPRPRCSLNGAAATADGATGAVAADMSGAGDGADTEAGARAAVTGTLSRR